MDLAWMSRALQYRNYRLFFTGQIVSLVGNWMSTVALSWLVYRLTGSTLLLGVVGFAGQIPSFLVAPFAGVWVDRLNRHTILKITQFLAMLQSLTLAFLTLRGIITVPHIIVLSALQGFINAFDMPARQSFVVQLVEKKEDLGNAIALNSSMVNAARLVGPALAGAIIALSSEGWCFLLDGISYLAVLASLMMMRVTQPPLPSQITAPVQALREGWVYVKNFAPIRTLLLLMAMVSLLSLPYTVLMPAVSTKILHGDSHTLGYLMAGSGVGALTGALFLASRRSVVGLGRIIPIATSILGVGLIAFSFSRVFWLSLILMPLMGFGFMVQMASSNTLDANPGRRRQARARDEFLHHVVYGHDALRQPAGGRAIFAHRRAAHDFPFRHLRRCRRRLVRHAIAIIARNRGAIISRNGNYAARNLRRQQRHRTHG